MPRFLPDGPGANWTCSQPDIVMVNARRLDDIDGPALKPTHFFGGRCREDAERKRIVNGGHVSATGLDGAAVSGRRPGTRGRSSVGCGRLHR
jgi:hypothetical protein